jgi:hypothetical protein
MADIVERLRERAENGDGWTRPVAREAAAEIERLREALRLAIDCVEHWGAYADSYSIAKYDLAGDLRDLRAVLEEAKS